MLDATVTVRLSVVADLLPFSVRSIYNRPKQYPFLQKRDPTGCRGREYWVNVSTLEHFLRQRYPRAEGTVQRIQERLASAAS